MTVAAEFDLIRRRLPPVNDRLLTTCFLAALLHGIIILGVTFSGAHDDAHGREAPGLQVILVSERGAKLPEDPKATYLAQRNQRGDGNSKSRDAATVPDSSLLPVERPGTRAGSGDTLSQPGSNVLANPLISSRSASGRIRYFAQLKQQDSAAQAPELLQDKTNVGLAANSEDLELRLRGPSPANQWVTADTRESSLAVYLDAWRRKVERLGTINFPNVARQSGYSATPVIEVEIAADGKLASAAVRRSSGNAEIDQAAIAILRLASPFDPFPRQVSLEHDEVRFAYEWQFLKGSVEGSGVFLPDDQSGGEAKP